MLSDLQKVQLIADFVGMSAYEIKTLGRGVASSAWQVTNARKSLVIRLIPTSTNRPVTYQSEFTILRMLHDKECPIPEPVLTSVELSKSLIDIPEPWAVTRAVKGSAIKDSPLSPKVAQDLGNLLSIIHSLPISHFGPLEELSDVLIGAQAEHLAGVCARWCSAEVWPFDGSNLQQHSIAELAPNLSQQLKPLEGLILDILTDGPVVLTHSDLHGEHIFEQDGSLTGIIDFGAAFISVPAWDFAVIAFFHGWQAAQYVLDSYDSPYDNESLLSQAQKLALIFSLYRLSWGIRSHAPVKNVNRILQFLADTLKKV